jgi:hypothetical protein
MYYRAVRRLIWARYGDIRNPPGPTEEIRKCLKATYEGRIRLMVEAGAFNRPGWLVLTNEELGFVSRDGGQVFSRAIPFEAITETRVERTPIYDYLHIGTKSERVKLRIFRSNRDITQELFNHLQLSLGALRSAKSGGNPAARSA